MGVASMSGALTGSASVLPPQPMIRESETNRSSIKAKQFATWPPVDHLGLESGKQATDTIVSSLRHITCLG